jgi:hypothetical protein
LSGMAICCIFVVFLCALHPFCLNQQDLLEGTYTSTDNTTYRDSLRAARLYWKYIDTPPSSIALIF